MSDLLSLMCERCKSFAFLEVCVRACVRARVCGGGGHAEKAYCMYFTQMPLWLIMGCRRKVDPISHLGLEKVAAFASLKECR